MQTAEIAYRQGIPEAYLDQLMTTLNKFGFVLSRRGPQGGHRLASDPVDIDLGMVMKTLDGSSSPSTVSPTLWTVYFPIRAPNKRYGRRLRKPYKTFSATSA